MCDEKDTLQYDDRTINDTIRCGSAADNYRNKDKWVGDRQKRLRCPRCKPCMDG